MDDCLAQIVQGSFDVEHSSHCFLEAVDPELVEAHVRPQLTKRSCSHRLVVYRVVRYPSVVLYGQMFQKKRSFSVSRQQCSFYQRPATCNGELHDYLFSNLHHGIGIKWAIVLTYNNNSQTWVRNPNLRRCEQNTYITIRTPTWHKCKFMHLREFPHCYFNLHLILVSTHTQTGILPTSVSCHVAEHLEGFHGKVGVNPVLLVLWCWSLIVYVLARFPCCFWSQSIGMFWKIHWQVNSPIWTFSWNIVITVAEVYLCNWVRLQGNHQRTCKRRSQSCLYTWRSGSSCETGPRTRRCLENERNGSVAATRELPNNRV